MGHEYLRLHRCVMTSEYLQLKYQYKIFQINTGGLRRAKETRRSKPVPAETRHYYTY